MIKELSCRNTCPYIKRDILGRRPCASEHEAIQGDDGKECRGAVLNLRQQLVDSDPRIVDTRVEVQGDLFHPQLALYAILAGEKNSDLYIGCIEDGDADLRIHDVPGGTEEVTDQS